MGSPRDLGQHAADQVVAGHSHNARRQVSNAASRMGRIRAHVDGPGPAHGTGDGRTVAGLQAAHLFEWRTEAAGRADDVLVRRCGSLGGLVADG